MADEKIRRRVFQELFFERSDVIERLDERTAAYLRSQRSEKTLMSWPLPAAA